ncbi:MAG: FapA family protein [bacterium]|nr:FapA family protein [bacterium]
MEQSQVEVQGTFVARDVQGRNVSAERILIGAQCAMSSLSAGTDICIDGDLVGGVTTFSGNLQVLGDMGNDRGAKTRIRMGGQARSEAKQERLDSTITTLKTDLEKISEQLDTHNEAMEKKSKKSAYWKALMQGEKKVPQGPTERALLMVFAKDVKEKARLERALEDGKREIDDVTKLKGGSEEEGGEQGSEQGAEAEGGGSLTVRVRGTVYEGVMIEMIGPLEAGDLELKVRVSGRATGPVSIQDVKKDLAVDVAAYVEPMKERATAQEAAIEAMFKDRENKPPVTAWVNKRFEVEFQFVKEAGEESDGEAVEGADENEKPQAKEAKPAETPAPGSKPETADLSLPERGVLFVYALEPQNYFLKHVWAVRDQLKNVAFSVAQSETGCSVTYARNDAPLKSWRSNPEIVEFLEATQIQTLTARTLLFGTDKKQKEPAAETPSIPEPPK